MSPNRIINLANFPTFTAINVLSDPGAIGGPVVVPLCTQVVLNWTLVDGKTAHNVLYGRSAAAPNPTVAMADAIFTALSTGAAWTALALFMAPASSFAGVSLRSVDTPNLPILTSTGAAKPGTAPGAAMPNEVAAVITLRTALTGRANRGRCYIPSWTIDAMGAGNTIVAGAMTALQTWANTLPGAFTGSGMTFVIGQKARAAYTGKTGTLHPARAATSTAITSQVVRDNHWDSQRRRGLK